MFRKKIYFSLIIILFFSLFIQTNSFTLAAEGACPSEGIEGVDFLFFQGPLVPCGRQSTCNTNSGVDQTEPCTLCHLILLFKNVFDLLFSLLITTTVLFLTIGGVLYIVSAGKGLKTTAKGIITKTLIGFIIFLLSWLLVNITLNLLSVNKDGSLVKENWYNFSCSTESSGGGGTGTGRVGGETGRSGEGGGGRSGRGGENGSRDNETEREQVSRNNLGSNISVWESSSGATNIRDLKPETRAEIIDLQRVYGGRITVTGGAEGGNRHNERGEYTHINGYKFDVDDDTALDNYIRSNFEYIGPRADGAELYQRENGVYYAYEGNHWDVCVNCPLPTMQR